MFVSRIVKVGLDLALCVANLLGCYSIAVDCSTDVTEERTAEINAETLTTETVEETASSSVETENATTASELNTEDQNTDQISLSSERIVYAASGETKYTDNTGRTQFDDLTAGVYLISEIKGNTKYERFMPFLAVLPYDNNGKWEFNLIAKPKFGQLGEDKSMDITVKKIWNDDGQNRPHSITAELLCDGSVFASVELSSENGWTHQWNDLDSTKKWSVREQQVPKDYTVTYSQNGNTYTIYNTRS